MKGKGAPTAGSNRKESHRRNEDLKKQNESVSKTETGLLRDLVGASLNPPVGMPGTSRWHTAAFWGPANNYIVTRVLIA